MCLFNIVCMLTRSRARPSCSPAIFTEVNKYFTLLTCKTHPWDAHTYGTNLLKVFFRKKLDLKTNLIIIFILLLCC